MSNFAPSLLGSQAKAETDEWGYIYGKSVYQGSSMTGNPC